MLAEPFDVGGRAAWRSLADPQGAAISVWQAGPHRGAQLVNEPGTWNFSELNTRDVDGARAFYGAVFGWEADPIDLGEGESTMLRLPGYGDYLERARPRHCAPGMADWARRPASRTSSPG